MIFKEFLISIIITIHSQIHLKPSKFPYIEFTGRYIDALKNVLNNAPLGSSNQVIKVSIIEMKTNFIIYFDP